MKRVAIAVAAALTLAGCGRPGGGATADRPEIIDHAPANLPAYARLYPGARIQTSVDSGAAGGMVSFTAPASRETLLAFYKKAAASAGLTQTVDAPPIESGAQVAMFAQAGSNRSLTVNLEPAPAGAKVDLSYGAP